MQAEILKPNHFCLAMNPVINVDEDKTLRVCAYFEVSSSGPIDIHILPHCLWQDGISVVYPYEHGPQCDAADELLRFGMLPEETVAVFNPNAEAWSYMFVWAVNFFCTDLKDGDQFVWVKVGVLDLPGIDDVTGKPSKSSVCIHHSMSPDGLGRPFFDRNKDFQHREELAFQRARAMLRDRGLPHTAEDVDEYLMMGLPDVMSDVEESDVELQ